MILLFFHTQETGSHRCKRRPVQNRGKRKCTVLHCQLLTSGLQSNQNKWQKGELGIDTQAQKQVHSWSSILLKTDFTPTKNI